MKSEKITDNTVVNITFPVLMESLDNELIVLFVSENEGTVVNTKRTDTKIGYYSSGWANCNYDYLWRKFNGTIKLTN